VSPCQTSSVNHRLALARKLLPLLAFVTCSLSLSAQFPHPEMPREAPVERPPEERLPPESSNGHINGRVNLPSEESRNARNDFFPIPKRVIWERSADPSRPYAAYELTPGPPPQKVKLDRDALKNLQASKVPIVYSGDIPRGEAWQDFIAKQSTTTIIHEPTSANKDLHSIAEATALGKRPLSQNTKVFNALPQESDPVASHQERTRMDLQNTGTAGAWKSLNESIRPEVERFDHPFAAKKAILNELGTGTSDVVLIYAHFDGERLHLPGREGTYGDHIISVDEIASLKRTVSSDRIIVLVACETAKPRNGRSLASVLLQHGLARTVFATEQKYDARNIPALMKKLREPVPLREAGGQLMQYVELQQEAGLPDLLSPRSPAFE
jgi:hypothetical protein